MAAILQQTAGYPYFLQLYGDLLWRRAAGTTITLAKFERLRPEIESVLDRGFHESRYLRTTPRERAVLHAIARQGEPASVRQIQAVSGLANNVLRPALASLVRHGLADRPARGVLAFAAPCSAPIFGGAAMMRLDKVLRIIPAALSRVAGVRPIGAPRASRSAECARPGPPPRVCRRPAVPGAGPVRSGTRRY